MGRISKRRSRQEAHTVKMVTTTKYNVGVYARLSSDADQRKNESIDSQIDIIKECINKNNMTNNDKMEIFDIYTDLGKTGTNFSRDEFARLMQDIRIGDVNCVIVKDLSRFGRNYLEAGNYIEKIFPFLGVRFIAVTDGFDTEDTSKNNKGLSLEIKNLVNDMYAKDLSKKTAMQLQQRREQGSYIGGRPPYGYETYWDNKIRRLKVDIDVVPIIKLIYETFIEEQSYAAVANKLNKLRINPPSVYRETKEVYYIGEQYRGWDKTIITSILTSATYIGNLSQGKTTITGKLEANRVKKTKEEWLIKEKVHEPIISDEVFMKAQQTVDEIKAISKAKKSVIKNIPLEENIFDNIIFCGVCGKKLTRSTNPIRYGDGRIERTEAYSCFKSVKGQNDNCKEYNRITKQILSNILLVALKTEFALCLENPKKYMEHGNQVIKDLEYTHNKKIRDINLTIEKLMELESNNYIRYRKEEISEDTYFMLKTSNDKKLQQLYKDMEEVVACKKNIGKVAKSLAKSIRSLILLREAQELNREIVESLIEKIYLYPDKRLEIIYKYTDDILKGVK